jgi:hypothetical protein
MPFNKIITWAAVGGALVMLGGATAQAKGPKGGGHGASPTFTRGTPQAQANGKSDCRPVGTKTRLAKSTVGATLLMPLPAFESAKVRLR